MIITDLKLYLLHATSCDLSDMWSLAKFIQQHLRAVRKHNWKSLPPPGCSLNTWSNPREPELSTWPGHSGPLQPCSQATFQWLSPQTLAAHSKSHKVGILARRLAILKHICCKLEFFYLHPLYKSAEPVLPVFPHLFHPNLGLPSNQLAEVKGEQRTRLNYVEELGAQVIFANQPPARPRNGSDATLVQGWVWQLWGNVNAWTSKSVQIVFLFKHGPPKTGWSFFGSFCMCHISLDS